MFLAACDTSSSELCRETDGSDLCGRSEPRAEKQQQRSKVRCCHIANSRTGVFFSFVSTLMERCQAQIEEEIKKLKDAKSQT